MRTLDPRFLFGVRLVLAAIWLYEGFWLKIWRPDAHELAIVSSFAATPQGARQLMALIGAAETALAFGILSGLYWRLVSCFQIGILLVMNLTGILFGKGTIHDPAGLIIHNLPLFACMALVALHGPGSWRAPAPNGRAGSKGDATG